MTRTRLAEGIFLVRFETQYALASTFLRIQEHYESSRFRKRVFSLEEYMDWYATEYGAFTYFEDWSGFNVPSTAFTDFYAGKFDPLLRKEERLLQLFRTQRAPFYVIGLASDADLTHELAHALFFTRPAYRRAVLKAMRPYDTSALEKRLLDLGYHRRVLADEVHAYLVAPAGALGTRRRALDPLRKELKALFRQHAGALSLLPAARQSSARPNRPAM
jgi:hypothetical protein